MRTRKEAMRSPQRYYATLKEIRARKQLSQSSSEASDIPRRVNVCHEEERINDIREEEMINEYREEEIEAEAEEDGDGDGDGDGNGDDFEDGEDYRDAFEEVVQTEDNACRILATHFGNIASRESREDDEEDSDEEEEVWRDDYIPEHDEFSSGEDNGDEEYVPEQTADDEGNELSLGKTFGSAVDFKKALFRYSLKSGYDVKLYISSAKRCGAICSAYENPCKWRIYCSYERSKHKLQVKVFEDKHSCSKSGYTKLLKSSTIADLYSERLRVEPKFTAKEMAAEILRLYGLRVSAEQCRKAKTRINKAKRKEHEEQFARIWDYEAEILKTNPGSVVDIETTPGPTPGGLQRFHRMYLCFAAQRDSWKHYCRPVIGVDGAFLKWDIKGQLLAAVGRDGDNRIVPIAWAIVEIENDTNWDWFIHHLKIDLGLGEGKNYAIISDKQKGLVKAVNNQLPEAEHRMCARHVLGHWRRDTRDMELERLFWRIAKSYTEGDYLENFEALRQHSQIAYDALLKLHPETWCRAFFKEGTCCSDILNNLCESFNRTIREARTKPLLDLLEDIRRQCMVRTAKRSFISQKLETRFTKSAHKQLNLSIGKSRECVRYISTGDMYEIDQHGCSYRVDMRLRKCGCLKWQLNGIPCEHAASVIIGKKLNVEDYVSAYYTADGWRHTYENGIQPVEGKKLWPRSNRLPVLPPPNRVGKPGRPSKYARRKSQTENTNAITTRLTRRNRVMTCSKCREEGHNKSSCNASPIAPPAKRPRGRPRKHPVDNSVGSSQGAGSQASYSQEGISSIRGSQL